MNRSILLLCFFVMALFSCRRDLSYTGGPDNNINIVPPDPVTATLQGNVLDENEQPAAGVVVKVGNKTVTTDSKGFFRMLNAAMDKNAAVVTAEKSGYFKAYRSFAATNGTNYVSIKLIKRVLIGNVNATSGGEVTLSNGAKIALKANGVAVGTASGAAYTGKVNIYAAYIDPTAADISQRIPGSLMADDKNGSRVILASYGMMAVELESETGAKLQIKSGSTATLSMPVPTSLTSSAPANIPLWYVDEQSGIWQEEGSATKTGNTYTGEVSHFSFWNCDISIPSVNVSLTLVNNAGQPLVHVPVKIGATTFPSFAYGYTDSLGKVSGLVPANQPLVLAIQTPCYTTVFSQNIGPFTQNTNLGTITVNSSAVANAFVTVQGKLLNCSNNPVTNGYAIVGYGYSSRFVATDASGNFTVSFLHCPGSNTTSLQVIGVDSAGAQQSAVVNVPISSPVTNAGNITACGISAVQYISYTLNGTSYYVSGIDSIGGTTQQQMGSTIYNTSLQAANTSNYVYINFSHSNQTAGTYPVNGYIGLYYPSGGASAQGNTNVNVTITNFPQTLGQFYEGTFSGTFVQGTTTYTVTNGSFRLRRLN